MYLSGIDITDPVLTGSAVPQSGIKIDLPDLPYCPLSVEKAVALTEAFHKLLGWESRRFYLKAKIMSGSLVLNWSDYMLG